MTNNKKKEGDEKQKRTLSELIKLSKEPTHNKIEKKATISDDGKSLLLRIPQEITKLFGIKSGDKIKFSGKINNGKTSELKIKWEKI